MRTPRVQSVQVLCHLDLDKKEKMSFLLIRGSINEILDILDTDHKV